MGAPAAGADFPIVGLGASAGGLEALAQFLRAMPADSGMGFVLVLHLDPDHPSILTEILQRYTTMTVVEADDKMPVLPDRVHVIPPNRELVVRRGRLQLSLPAEPRGQRLPIDALFRSLAEDQGDNVAGIILSGSGTDGTLGLRAIHGAGGLCLVQEPSEAKVDGMPASAIRAGYASQVLAVDTMPQALLLGLGRPGARPASALPGPGLGSGLHRILALLRSSTGHDFSQYKKSTIGRRVERRMALHAISDPADYARHLRLHPDELQTLFRELLINVTSFFRDPQAFDLLKSEVLPALLAGRPDNAVLRIWVAGCATGEEAYSLAMLLHEWMDVNHRDLKIQFYATDLDDDAIATARAGLYPPNIAQDVSPERLRRCFSKEDNGFRVRKEIREMVVFAVQSVIKDPPFTRLDLLSCRNLMIYLEPELQDRLIPAFHYALKAGGVLLLSPSEGIGRHADLFESVNRRWKLYRARPSLASTRAVLASGLSWAASSSLATPQDTPRRPRETQIAELARRSLLQAFAPAAVVVDLQGNILYVHGETGRFLRPAPGQPSHRVVDMAHDGLQTELREALRRAAEGQPTLHRVLQVRGDGPPLAVSLSVQTMPGAAATSGVLLVSFQELPAEALAAASRKPRGGASAAQLRVQELERELADARENMSAMLEEQQASNEELKSTNEELQSTNEELQSTNEELETSKEELQSVNEEMVTVNAELQTKIDQMSGMQDDMKNLLDNMRLGTIFLDRQLTIRRFTRDAAKIYRLLGSDVGRPLADFRSALVDADLLADALTVLKTLTPIEREVCTTTGTWYLARIQPYRTVDNAVDGVVLSFADVTEQVQAIAARNARALAESIVEAVPVPLVVLDAGLRVVSANRAYFSAFGGTPADTAGRPYVEIGARQWDQPALRTLLEQVLPLQRSVEHQDVTLAGQGDGPRQLGVSARCIADPAGQGDLVLLAIAPALQAAG